MKIENRILKYAQLCIRKGLNVQPDQEVIINAGLDQISFVELLVQEAYSAGAKRVVVNWHHDPVTRLQYLHESLESLSNIRSYEIERRKWMSEILPAILHVVSDDPNALQGVDQKKVSQARQKTYPIIKPFIDKMEDKYQWCIAAVPSVKWAKIVYPELSEKAAVSKLWRVILDCSRVHNDPVEEWAKHNANLHEKCQLLNSYNFDYLHYRSQRGTDLKVWLNPQGIFLGGSEKTRETNIEFNPNIPSEEVFTTPLAGRAEGKVYATMPLSYNGELIDDFSLVFKDGKVSEIKAKKNEKLLRTMIESDAGAARLGEVALVPVNSPIKKTNTLFYETLYDENAACHLALGRGFDMAIKDAHKYTHAEIQKMGVNESMIHVDFMIGDETLDIDGCTRNGTLIPVFRAGKWVI